MATHRLPRERRGTRSGLRHAVVAPLAVLVASGAVVAVTPAVLNGDPTEPAAAEHDVAASEDASDVALPARAPKAVDAPAIYVGPYADYHQPASEIPSEALAAYQRAASVMATAAPSCHLDWTVLAAIGRIASDHGGGPEVVTAAGRQASGKQASGKQASGKQASGKQASGERPRAFESAPVKRIVDTDAGRLDGDKRWDVGVGPLQFLPAAWSVVAVDSDDDGSRDPEDIDDAALAAAVLLCGHDRDLSQPADFRAAALMFNSTPEYPALVARLARAYERDFEADGSGTTVVVDGAPSTSDPTTRAVTAAGGRTPLVSTTPTPSEVAEATSDSGEVDLGPTRTPPITAKPDKDRDKGDDPDECTEAAAGADDAEEEGTEVEPSETPSATESPTDAPSATPTTEATSETTAARDDAPVCP